MRSARNWARRDEARRGACVRFESPPPRCRMERAARLFNNKKLSREIVGGEEIARAIWPAAVGKAIAAHTSRIKLVRSTLVVEVEDAIWQKQLHGLTAQILQRLQKLSGNDQIRDIEFRIGVPRRTMQRAESRETPSVHDEAEEITDPVLRKVFRMSRKA